MIPWKRYWPLVLHLAIATIFSWPARSADKPAGADLYRVEMNQKRQVEEMTRRGIDILSVDPREGVIYVAADAGERDLMQGLGYSLATMATYEEGLRRSASQAADLDDYHTYGELFFEMSALADTHASICALITLGNSVEGRPIQVWQITDNPGVDEGEPQVFINGNHHARELMSVEISFLFGKYLLENYGDPRIKSLVDSREIWILPMLNPDGHAFVEGEYAAGDPWWTWWRKNRRVNPDMSIGVDLNRNYSYNFGYDDLGSSPVTTSPVYRGPSAFSEPESQIMRDFVNAHEFSIVLNYHSYGELLLFPWGYEFGYTPDHEVYLTLADSMTASNGYWGGNPAMGTIYLTNGASDDWMYGDTSSHPKAFSFTPEMNSNAQGGFGPPDTEIAPTFDLLLPMNLFAVEYAENPYRVVGPARPTLFPLGGPGSAPFLATWSGDPPGEMNPAVAYRLEERSGLAAPTDDAEADYGLWSAEGWTRSTTRKHEGFYSWYSGMGDNLLHTLTVTDFYPVTPETDTLTLWAWYDIEADWDYAYVQASRNGGLIWENLAGSITTNADPNAANLGNGITGSSGGWVPAYFPLVDYQGEIIDLRLTYMTDGSVVNEGIYADLIEPVPSFADMRVVIENVNDTLFTVTPESLGTYYYLVRCRDGENHWSLPSNIETYTVNGFSTAAEEELPGATSLEQNVPNPFNPRTAVAYATAAPGRVELEIFDARGRSVRTLVAGFRPAGRHRVVWNGLDDAGYKVASGVYFYRLEVEGEAPLTRKMILLK